MRILITGSEGFLGSHLKRELRARGHNVYGCDLMHTADPSIMRADVAEYRQIDRAFTEFAPDICFHLAGEFGRHNGNRYGEQLWRTNCIGTHNVIELCRAHGCRLVFASSSEAYGDLADTYNPLPESLLDTNVPQHHNEYALSKYTGEMQIRIANRNYLMRSIILRFFNVYGPGELYSTYRSVVCRFLYRLLRQETITAHRGWRDFLYIDDWVRTVANIVPNIDCLGGAYNIGGDGQVSIEYLATLCYHACELDTRAFDRLVMVTGAEPHNVIHKIPDISKAQRDLDHNPRTSLELGLHRTVEWMRREYDISKVLTFSTASAK